LRTRPKNCILVSGSVYVRTLYRIFGWMTSSGPVQETWVRILLRRQAWQILYSEWQYEIYRNQHLRELWTLLFIIIIIIIIQPMG